MDEAKEFDKEDAGAEAKNDEVAVASLAPAPVEDAVASLAPARVEDAVASLAPAPVEVAVASLAPAAVADAVASLAPAAVADAVASLAPAAVAEDSEAQLVSAPVDADAEWAIAIAAANEGDALPPPAAETERTPVFAIRWLLFGGAKRAIFMQEENGPCPLLALANIVSLLGKLTGVAEGSEFVTLEVLLQAVAGYALSLDTAWASTPEQRASLEMQLGETLAALPALANGLDVNPRFTGPGAFELTSATALMDVLNIRMMHAWVVDPQADARARGALGSITFNAATILGLAADATAASGTANAAAAADRATIVDEWLMRTASQITPHGVACLWTELQHNELAVFYRSGHFSVVYKPSASSPHGGALLTLITDAGYASTSAAWETLSGDVTSGTNVILDEHFRPLWTPPPPPPPPTVEEDEEAQLTAALRASLEVAPPFEAHGLATAISASSEGKGVDEEDLSALAPEERAALLSALAESSAEVQRGFSPPVGGAAAQPFDVFIPQQVQAAPPPRAPLMQQSQPRRQQVASQVVATPAPAPVIAGRHDRLAHETSKMRDLHAERRQRVGGEGGGSGVGVARGSTGRGPTPVVAPPPSPPRRSGDGLGGGKSGCCLM